jgi:phenylalanyl-tRNA synthetase beta chain
VRLFETGLRFIQPPNQAELDVSDVKQDMMLAGLICGSRRPENWTGAPEAVDFYDIKGDVESLLSLLGGIGQFDIKAGTHPALHPGQTAVIERDGEVLGVVGQLHPQAQKALDIGPDVYLFELEVAKLIHKPIPSAVNLSKYPEVRRDIAIIVDNPVSAREIDACIQSVQVETFKYLKLFDVYQGKGIDPNRKSVALGLTFQHASRTLTDDEINGSVDQIVAALTKNLDAILRN